MNGNCTNFKNIFHYEKATTVQYDVVIIIVVKDLYAVGLKIVYF